MINGSLPFSQNRDFWVHARARPRAVQVCPIQCTRDGQTQALGKGTRLHTASSVHCFSGAWGPKAESQEWPGLGWGCLWRVDSGPQALRESVRGLGRSGVSSVWGGQDREALVSWPRARTSRQAWELQACWLPARPTRVTDRLSHLLGRDGAR